MSVINLFMCGDVMTGRGIDQILPCPGDPVIYEPFMKSAAGYVDLAGQVNGRIPAPVHFSYIWGDALAEFERIVPDVKIINLETAVTTSDDYWKGKEINYRMNPENISCLSAAGIDYCSLANNHVLDWGYSGLAETIETLKKANIKSAGAGRNLNEAEAPAVMEVEGKGRVIVFSFGSETGGIPYAWAAAENRPGINLLKDLTDKTIRHISEKVREVKQPGDVVVASIHWGGNWGYEITREQINFAHKLINHAWVDVVHGHSPHHVKAIEVYSDRLVLYGCGDFLNDYEGISGYEYYRGDLGLMYFASIDTSAGKLASLQMIPTRIKHFKVNRASGGDTTWLRNMLNREGKEFKTRLAFAEDNSLALKWD
jgi:poly-gamma-glutamate capsule biosynthesis protein CapA/YwtB (metallophosphatase superfamily)